MAVSCKRQGCPREVKASGLCHYHLKEASAPRVLKIGTSDFSTWRKTQNMERSWKKEAVNNDRHARARRKRTDAINNATPVWLSPAQLKSMKDMYAEARLMSAAKGEPYEVDHIVPLHGETVCGLHVPWNMQVIRKKDNNVKGNRDYDAESEGETKSTGS